MIWVMEKIKESKNKIIISVVIFALGVLLGLVSLSQGGTKEWSELSFGFDNSSAQSITCSYKHILRSENYDGAVTQYFPEPETNPIVMTYSNFGEELAELSYIDATQTITTLPVAPLVEGSDKIIYLEGGDQNYLTIHTIYPSKGVATFTKNYEILGRQIATMSMGTCTGY